MCPSNESKRTSEGFGVFLEVGLSGLTVSLIVVMLALKRMPGATALLW